MEYTAIKTTGIKTSSARSRLALCVFSSAEALLDMARDLGNAGIASDHVVVLTPAESVAEQISNDWQAGGIDAAVFSGHINDWQARAPIDGTLQDNAAQLISASSRLVEKHLDATNIILLIKFKHGDAETLISGVLLAGRAKWVEVHDLSMIS